MLNFRATFSLSSFTFVKRLFDEGSSSLSYIRLVSYAFLKLLIFLLAILIPVCASSILAFHKIYSAYKLNKQCDNIQPWHTHFPILNQSVVPCLVLTVASWPAYRFLMRQVRWSDIPISKNLPQFLMIHTLKAFGIIQWNRCFSLSIIIHALSAEILGYLIRQVLLWTWKWAICTLWQIPYYSSKIQKFINSVPSILNKGYGLPLKLSYLLFFLKIKNETRLVITHYSADTSTLSGSLKKKKSYNTHNTRCSEDGWEFDSWGSNTCSLLVH